MYQTIAFITLGLCLLLYDFLLLRKKNVIQKGSSTRDLILEEDGNFEWHWAGQNWKGKVEFKLGLSNQVEMKMNVNKEYHLDKKNIQHVTSKNKILSTVKNGEISFSDKSFQIKGLIVNKTIYKAELEKNKYIEYFEDVRSADLEITAEKISPIIAFGGKVKYRDRQSGKEWFGDLVFVNYKYGVYS